MRYFIFVILLMTLGAEGFELQKANIYHEQNVTGWLMSEKLDGIRGLWNGKMFMTKRGYRIDAPDYFMKNFPPFALDGELWIARGAFEEVQSVVLDENPSDRWKQVTYNIFEVPDAEGNFTIRLAKVKQWFYEHPNSYVKIIPQKVCLGTKALRAFLKGVVEKGGEGVMVKDPKSVYFSGRSSKILKVKMFSDAEGEVIAINPGKGKYSGMMGSIRVRMNDGIEFNIGSGFSDKIRKKPMKTGDIVTFKYYGRTKNNKPKFASFLRVRNSKTIDLH